MKSLITQVADTIVATTFSACLLVLALCLTTMVVFATIAVIRFGVHITQ